MGCDSVQVHVRRGDKWKESPPVANELYESAAQLLHSRAAGGPTPLQQRLFVSTEDASAVDFFVNQTSWEVEWAETGLLKQDKEVGTIEYARRFGAVNDMTGSLLNLRLALECNAWVGTLSSNWCRLIDELRSTVGCKAHLPFADPAQTNPLTYKYYQ